MKPGITSLRPLVPKHSPTAGSTDLSANISIFYRKNYDPYFTLLGHACSDMNQGALPAILTYLYYHGTLTSLECIAWFVFASNMVSSVIQPLVGAVSDRRPRPWLMAAGILLAAAGTSAMGFCTNQTSMMICCVASGIGIAVFHPAGGKVSHSVADRGKLGKSLSIFYVGGNIGFAVGPVLVTAAMSFWGIRGTLIMLLPALLVAAALLYMDPKFTHAISREKRRMLHDASQGSGQKERVGAFMILTGAIFFRATIFFAFITFIPVFWVKILHESVETGSTVLSITAVVGAISTLYGGRLTDRIGSTRTFRLVLTIVFPLLAAFCLVDSHLMGLLIIVPLSFFLYSSSAPMMAMGQNFLCKHTGLASGVTVGLAVSFGGISSPVLGWIGDQYGLHATFWTLTFCALCAMLISYVIPIAEKPGQTGSSAAEATPGSESTETGSRDLPGR